jgi:hypothetical protein
MLRLNRHDIGAWALAATLAAGTATAAGNAVAQPESAGTAAARYSAGEDPEARWQRLKSRYQHDADAAPVNRPSADIPGSTLPVPESLPGGWTSLQPATAAPFPELTDAPPWIVAAPAPAPADRPTPAPVLATAPFRSTAAPVTAPAPEVVPQPLDPFGWQPPANVSPPIEAQIIAAGRQDGEIPPMPTPDLANGRRSVRPISEISPFYDLTVDQDIRDYANQRATEYNVKFGAEEFQPRMFPDVAMSWEASNFYHFPLYFEDPALERYGHTRSFFVQPFVSGARFMGQLVALPYQMTIDPIDKPVYALGWYRPGECAPKLKYQVPFNAEAAAVQAAVTTGMIFLIP